jgi:two-component system, chemotaxis family, chemotaxis protein CheY
MPHILAVDDSPSMRHLVVMALRNAGYEVDSANDGSHALAAARRGHYDAVLTDINMPNMDGITLVRELRALPSYRSIPILILTTEATPERRQESREAGATGWLVKPFRPHNLLSIVERILPS